MGFLKRIFSFGNKKKRSTVPDVVSAPSVDNERRRKLEEEHEAAVGRLLRSSSSRYAIVKEIDYSNLPPLPHPINDVLAGCNTAPKEHAPSLRLSPSVVSLASSSLSRHSTFSVTVHDRQRHAATEFPNANRELVEDTDTPTQCSKRQSHQLGLRSDPSVASLISLYDEHGRLPAETFSNSPPSSNKQERPQKKRGGSTLRELLGGSGGLGSKSGSHLESDISWAEKYLCENENGSSPSSLGPHTPSACIHSTHDHMALPKAHDFTFSSESSTSVPNDPAITSMEVEFSDTSSTRDANPYTDLTTPQRASQIFSFITKRSSVQHERVPSLIPFSSSLDKPYNVLSSRFSTDESLFDGRTSRQSRSSLGTFQDNSQTPMQRTPKHRTAPVPSVAEDDGASEPPQRKVRVLMTGPTKIMVTEPTPGGQSEQVLSRIPIRGPLQNPNKRKAPHTRRTPMLMLTQHTNTANSSASSRGSARSRGSSTGIPRHRPLRKNAGRVSTTSTTSSFRAEADALAVATACALDQLARSRTYPQAGSPTRTPRGGDKENQRTSGALLAKMDLPSTPLRGYTNGKSPLSRKAVAPSLFQCPSAKVSENSSANKSEGGGNSSSELSPLGKQMMLDARQQRMRVKEWDKERRSGVCSTPGSSTRAAGQPF